MRRAMLAELAADCAGLASPPAPGELPPFAAVTGEGDAVTAVSGDGR